MTKRLKKEPSTSDANSPTPAVAAAAWISEYEGETVENEGVGSADDEAAAAATEEMTPTRPRTEEPYFIFGYRAGNGRCRKKETGY